MQTSLVATMLLIYRKGISLGELVKKTVWIYEEVKARKGDMSINSVPNATMVTSCL
jgi:hypothetical protein